MGCCCVCEESFWLQVIVEVVRYVAIVLPLFLSVWRASQLTTLALDSTFIYLILTLATLLVYIPLKFICGPRCLKWARERTGWRPSILLYILLCGLPSMALLAWSIVSSSQETASYTVDAKSMMVIQFVIVGLVVTEGAAKSKENVLDTNTLSAIGADLFYAYDVYDFFETQLDADQKSDAVVYVVFVFGFLSMFKFLPGLPPQCQKAESCPNQAAGGILTGVLCQDLPFLVIRVTTLIDRGATAKDFLYPLKNLVQVILGSLQLGILGNIIKTGAHEIL